MQKLVSRRLSLPWLHYLACIYKIYDLHLKGYEYWDLLACEEWWWMQQTGMMSCCHRRCQEPLESNKNRGKEKKEWNPSYTAVITDCYCVIPENIHTSPTEGIFSKTPHPLWKSQLSFIHFFKFFGLAEPPTPPGNSNPFWGGMDIFWNCAIDCNRWLVQNKL